MQPRVQFAHLRIPETWPTSIDEFYRIIDQHQVILRHPAFQSPGVDYAQWTSHMERTLQDSLIASMRQIFQRNARPGQRYHQVCIDHMVAVILKHFGLETKGTESQMVARFRKRLRDQNE